MMIGIVSIAYFLPAERLSNFDRMNEFALTEAFITEKLGVKAIAVREKDHETSDLCVAAAHRLFLKTRIDPTSIGCLVVVTQNPDGRGLPQTSALVHAKLGLSPHCLVFDIGLGCSGFVSALSIVASTMQSAGISRGLLITADPYSKIIDRGDRNTSLLFGDGASATLLGEDPEWQIGQFDFVMASDKCDALKTGNSGRLEMNGRAVFELCAKEVPDSIRRAAKLNDVSLDDVDRFVLHQGSKFIVDTIAGRIGAKTRAPFDATDYGNTVSSSVPITFERTVVPRDKLVMISGFGVGLSIATTLLKRVDG